MTFHLHPDDAALSAAAERATTASTESAWRQRFRRAARFSLHGLLCVTTLVFLYLIALQSFGDAGPTAFLLGLMCWGSAYLGGRLAGARAHLGVPNLAAVGEALVQVALALDRNQQAVKELADLDTSERAAATAMLMQAKGAVGHILRFTEGAQSAQLTEIRALAARIDEDITDSVRELSCIEYENETAVDEAATAVKH
jgi:hypothetical protein